MTSPAIAYLEQQFTLACSGREKAAAGITLTPEEQAAMRATSAGAARGMGSVTGRRLPRWKPGEGPGPDDGRPHP